MVIDDFAERSSQELERLDRQFSQLIAEVERAKLAAKQPTNGGFDAMLNDGKERPRLNKPKQ